MKTTNAIAQHIAEQKKAMEMEKNCLDLTVEKGGMKHSYYNNQRPTMYRNELERRSIYRGKRKRK